MSNWWSDHPDLAGVARRGRSEIEEDAAVAEADTELLRRRRRSLMDVCFEWMSRGDHVTVATGAGRFEGRLIAAVNDLLLLQTTTVEVAVNLAAVRFARSNKTASFAGTSGERNVGSFRAQLGRNEVDGTPLRLVGEAFDVTGVIAASTDDHVLVVDSNGVEWALPQSEIGHAVAAVGDE